MNIQLPLHFHPVKSAWACRPDRVAELEEFRAEKPAGSPATPAHLPRALCCTVMSEKKRLNLQAAHNALG